MFKLIFLFLLAVPLYGQVSVPLGTRANVNQEVCTNIGPSKKCVLVDVDGDLGVGPDVTAPETPVHIRESNASTTPPTAEGSAMLFLDNSDVATNDAGRYSAIGFRIDGLSQNQVAFIGAETTSTAQQSRVFISTEKAGVITKAVSINEDGETQLEVSVDGDCSSEIATGNVCSDYPSMPAISGSTCTGGSPTTINPVTVTRIGNIVTMMGQINNSGCNAGEVFLMALPIARTSGNFNTTEGAHGLFTSKTDGGLGTIESNNGTQTVRFTMGANTGGGRLGFTFSYSMVN
jgi:hypothetical protein